MDSHPAITREKVGNQVGYRVTANNGDTDFIASPSFRHIAIGTVKRKFGARGWKFTPETAYLTKKERNVKNKATEIDPRPGKTFENIIDPTPKAEPPREPTKAQFREIFAAIHEVWNDSTERYFAQNNDRSLSASLGIPRDWVRRIREEHFGPNDGVNFDLEALRRDIDAAINAAVSNQSSALDLATKFEENERTLKALRKKLEEM